MHNEIPSLYELMEIYEGDRHWNEYKLINNELTTILMMCHKDLSTKILWDNFLQDCNYYLLNYLTRSMRISASKMLLLINGIISEALMLNRPFLENIVETLLFIKRRSRARLMRRIRLYWLINEEKRISFYKEQIDHFYKDGHVGKYMNEHDERLENKVIDGLKEFNKEEIEKMRNKVENGHSWYGGNPKSAFKESGFFDQFDDYRQACTLLHVREENPSGHCVIPKREKELLIKMEFCKTLEMVLRHLICYESFCSEVFNKNNIIENLMNLDKKLREIRYGIMTEIAPDWDTFVSLE